MCRIGIVVWVLLVIALAGLPAGVQAQGADDGLVAEWHFDEGSGSVVADSSGNGNDGVIYGATWVEGKYGYGLRFDGVDDYVDIQDWNWATNMDYVVMAWVKTTDADYQPKEWRVGAPILGDSAGTVHGEVGLDNGKISYNYFGYNDIGHEVNGISTVADGSWHFLVWVNHNKNTMDIYVDSICENRGATSGPVQYETRFVAREIGRGYNDYFNGIIDEIRIYNRALTADEIKELYGGKQTTLSLTKSPSPHSIKQGQTTTITLTVTNTGTTEITDIEVSDTIPSDLTFISGETSKTYLSLRPKDSREFQYTLQLNDAGTFNLDPATATYSDEEGNYHTTESKTATITVIPSTDQPTTSQTAPKSYTDISTASVHLHGEKTDVVLGEDVLLKLSAVNIIGNPLMRVQVIIIPPSGWSVTSSEFAKSGAGQYTTTYDIKEGVGRDIEVRIMPNQIGDDFQVQGRIVYYFGDDPSEREDHTLTLPITVRAEAENGQGAERTADTSESEENGPSTPGFAAVVAASGVLLVALLIKRRGLR